MIGVGVLCGQGGMLLLAAGSIRGGSVISRRVPSVFFRRMLQSGGVGLMGLSLWLQLHNAATPAISLLVWIGIVSIEILTTTLVQTGLDRRRESPLGARALKRGGQERLGLLHERQP